MGATMKSLFLVFFLLFFILHQVYSEELRFEEILRKEFNFPSSNLNGFGEFVPFSRSSDGRSIIRNSNEISDEFDILLTENFFILEFAYNKNSQLLVYTYGHGSASIPVIFDIRNNQRTILADIRNNGGDEIVFGIVRNLAWKDDDTLLYTVFDDDTGMNHVKTYNIRTKHIEHIFTGRNITLFDFNAESKQMLFTKSTARGRVFYLFDFRSNSRSPVSALSQEYVVGFVFNTDRIIGLTIRHRMFVERSSLSIIQNDNVIMKFEGINNIVDVIRFNRDANVLVLVIEERSRIRYVVAVRLVE